MTIPLARSSCSPIQPAMSVKLHRQAQKRDFESVCCFVEHKLAVGPCVHTAENSDNAQWKKVSKTCKSVNHFKVLHASRLCEPLGLFSLL